MGGMTTLEYPLNTPPGFVRHIVPLATSARHSAWCISWGEAQRQSIYSDPEYRDGYYYELTSSPTVDSSASTNGNSSSRRMDLTNQPTRGLAAARMAALLTYRSRDSFESRFGRRAGGGASKVPRGGVRIMGGPETTDPSVPSAADLEHGAMDARERAWREHNDGHRSVSRRDSESRLGNEEGLNGDSGEGGSPAGSKKLGTGGERPPPKVFSAQSYLRYQGDKVRPNEPDPVHQLRCDLR